MYIKQSYFNSLIMVKMIQQNWSLICQDEAV